MFCINSGTCRKVCIQRTSPGATEPGGCGDGIVGVVVGVALDVVGKDSEGIIGCSVGRR